MFINDLFNKKQLNESLRDGEYVTFEVFFDDGTSEVLNFNGDDIDWDRVGARRNKKVVNVKRQGGIQSEPSVAPARPHQFPDDSFARAQRAYDRQIPEGAAILATQMASRAQADKDKKDKKEQEKVAGSQQFPISVKETETETDAAEGSDNHDDMIGHGDAERYRRHVMKYVKPQKDLSEMDKSAPQPGRDGSVSHKTYGSRDTTGERGTQHTVKPQKAKDAAKDAERILNKIKIKEQGVAEGEHPKTWHDVDPKLGKQVDKMSQAEKVSKGFAHSDTLKKKTSFIQKLDAKLQQLGYTQTQEGNVYRWTSPTRQFVEVEPNTEDPGWYGWAEGQVTKSGKLNYGDSGNDSAKDIVAIFKSGGVFRKQGVAEGSETNKYKVVVKGQKRSYSVWIEAKNEEVAIIRAQQYVAREHNDHGTRAAVVDMKQGMAEGSVYKKDQDLSSIPTQELEAFVKKHWGGGVPTYGQGKSVQRAMRELRRRQKQGVAEGISVVDQDYDLDQMILTLDIEGKKVSFTYWDYDENFANAERRDVFDQLQEQPWYARLDHPTRMEILDAAYRAIRGLEPQEYRPTVRDEPLDEQGVAEAAGLYGPFTVTINTGERPQSRTKTKKFRREDDAILWAEDWLEDFPQYSFATAQVTDPEGNVVWTTDEQGVAEAGPFSYGAKKPKKGSVSDLAARKRKEQERDKQPAEPRDQRVGVARVVKDVNENYGRYYCSTDKKWKQRQGPKQTRKVSEQQTTEASDISGLLAASQLNKSFIITAKTAEGATKRYRVRAQSERVAREKFTQHHAQATIVDVQPESVTETSARERLHQRHQELRKKSGLPDPKYYQELRATYDLPDAERYAKTAELKKKYGIKEARKPENNFDIEDIKRLEQVRDLPTLKTLAMELIARPSERPMKPEKVEWFKSHIENMNSPLKIIKLMYDLLLSGEGHAVIGSRKSMNPNSYRSRFGESTVTNEDVDCYVEELERAGYDLVTESATLCPECGGTAYADQLLAEKQDACYHKVKSRYKVWPSAYASGALVQCRKKGAANWGNKSKK